MVEIPNSHHSYESIIYYYAFCYLLSYSIPYYYGILHGHPCNIAILCLHHAPTRDRTGGLLIASKNRFRLSYAGP